MTSILTCGSTSWIENFPIFKQHAQSKPLIYLDSAATTQKPQSVIDAVAHYYCSANANVHRGIYALSERATAQYEATRQTVKQFIHARHNHEIIFTRGTTESINLVAHGLAQIVLQPEDEMVISTMEHHSNIVPWQNACEQTKAKLKTISLDAQGDIDLDQYEKLLTEKVKMVALTHVSNVLGTINPVKKMIALAHARAIPVLLDGAQAIAHLPVDVQELDCDFYAFSGHKIYGSTGVGILYGKEAWLEKLPPYQFGGDMIKRVSFEKTEHAGLPHKFEAGTPNMAGVAGLAAAINFIQNIGFHRIRQHDQELLNYATQRLQEIAGLTIIGRAKNKIGIISFILDQVHPHDIATILDHEGIAVRAGHHCAMPLMDYYHLPATVRASFGLYNDLQDIDCFIAGMRKVLGLLR